jgi:biopolymer transport protein ExbB/TolQ
MMDDDIFNSLIIIIMLILAWKFISYKNFKNENDPTTKKYWTNMNLCNEYTEVIHDTCILKEKKRQEIKYLQSSLRKSTLRNRNQNVEYATEEYIQRVEEELQDIEQTLKKLFKYREFYYLKTEEIKRKMNRIGMWQLS